MSTPQSVKAVDKVGMHDYTSMTSAKPPRHGKVRIAVGLAAGFLFSVILLTAALGGVRRSDLTVLYTGGWIVGQGDAARLYDLREQAQIERRLFNRKDLLPYVHPPFQALLLAPLTRLSPGKAYVVLGSINVLLWLFFQHLLRPHTPVPRNPYRYILLCSLFPPLWIALLQGQSTVLLLVLLSLTFVCLKRGQDFMAGVFLGLGLYKFPIVLPFALICLLSRKWKLMGGFGVSASLLGMLSVAAVRPSGVLSYANLLIDILRNPGNPAYWSMRVWDKMPTIKGFVAVLLTGRLTTMYINALTTALSATLVLFAAWRWRQEDGSGGRHSMGLMFAAALTISEVTAPHLYSHDLTLMLLAILLVIGWSQWSQPSGQRTILLACMVILYAPPLYVLLLEWKAMYVLAPVLVAFALSAISLARKADVPLAQASPPPLPAGGDEVD